MRVLLDTHILIWLATAPERLSKPTIGDLASPSAAIVFSTVSIWEIAIKRSLNRPDFAVTANAMLRWARERGFEELSLSSEHGIAAGSLPPIHRDPLDRALIGQAMVEGVVLLTADARLAGYGDVVRVV